MSRWILVVEDEPALGEMLCDNLQSGGYGAELVRSGTAARDRIAKGGLDLVILDIMLPGMDGFEVCRSIRRLGDVPIVMVTARSDSHDVVAGLEAGADDYLRKPFDPKELSARIRALLRRIRPDDDRPTQIQIDQLEVLPEAGVVRYRGEDVHLTRTEFRLLLELAANPDRVLSREDLLERVWGYDYFGDGRLVDVHVRRLRMKIEPDPANPRYVVTVRGMGYKLQT